jgi:[ribosomal protein S18]-alanine N-acetyltransferase
MFVSRMLAADRDAVEAIARESEAEVDVATELERSWTRIWVARTRAADPNPAGFLLAWAVADELHVINLATHPDRRRQGVAKALLGALLEHARSNCVRLVLLEVRRSNRAAIQLYRAHGFRAIGLRRGYYSDTSEDAIEMMLAFDPVTGHAIPGCDEIPIAEP